MTQRPPAGLCDACRYQRLVRTTRGSEFSLCERSCTDSAYPRYPRVPVLRCEGHEPRREAVRERTDETTKAAPKMSRDRLIDEAASIGPLALSWSGGKDSALALRALRAEHAIEPRALITTVTEEYGRVSMHGVRRALLERQAAAAGLPLVEVSIPPHCPNDVYEARMEQALASADLRGVEAVAFGDLFLEDIRAYREERLAAAGKRALFPLWGRDTRELGRAFIAAGFEAFLVCVDPRQLDASFAGRSYDEALLADLPDGVDPCGENGEFHTFVHAGPIFRERVECEVGEVTMREGFTFCDLRARPPSA